MLRNDKITELWIPVELHVAIVIVAVYIQIGRYINMVNGHKVKLETYREDD